MKFDSNYICNQYWYFHLMEERGGVGGGAMIGGCNFKCEMDKQWKHASTFFQSETYEVFFIFAQCLKDNDCTIHIPYKVVVCGIVVKVNP